MKEEPVSGIARQVLPCTGPGFAVMFVTGVLLSVAEAATNYFNWAFRIKLILLIMVGLNPLIFHLTVYRRVTWDLPGRLLDERVRPRCARWCYGPAIIVVGRLIAYVNM